MDDELYSARIFEPKSRCGASTFLYKSVTFDPYLLPTNKFMLLVADHLDVDSLLLATCSWGSQLVLLG